MAPFHLAFPVDDLAAAEGFYSGVLGCPIGRRSDDWIDFNMDGHQIVAHLSPDVPPSPTNDVDGAQVPVRHFGLVLDKARWADLAEKLKAADVTFLIEPRVRFAGQPGEQGTFFVLDPAGNGLEFKYMAEPDSLFRA